MNQAWINTGLAITSPKTKTHILSPKQNAHTQSKTRKRKIKPAQAQNITCTSAKQNVQAQK